MSVTHLNGLKEAAMLMHVLEDVGLEVAIDNEDGDASDVLERLLIRLDNLLQRFERHLRVEHLLHIMIYHLDFLYVNASCCITTKCTERVHRLVVVIPERVRIYLTIATTTCLFSLFRSFLTLAHFLLFFHQDLLHALDLLLECHVVVRKLINI